MELTMDLESRSAVDIRKAGMYRYAEDESTEIMCFAFRLGEAPTRVWIPENFKKYLEPGYLAELDMLGTLMSDQDVEALVSDPDIEIAEAHNAGFEECMWSNIMVKRHGFSPLPIKKLRCSAAKAAAFALPRALGAVGKALNTNIQKDDKGYKTMLKMCKPRKPRKQELEDLMSKGDVDQLDDKTFRGPDGIVFHFWHETPEDFEILITYCIADVDTEKEVSGELLPLSDFEQKVWATDLAINKRGVYLDIEGVKRLIKQVEQAEEELKLEIKEITDDKVSSVKAIAATITWLNDNGVYPKNLQKETVEKLLAMDLPEKPKRLLEIRQILGKSSVAKLNKMIEVVCRDGRARGLTMYHGANTGRWSGKHIQPQNLPRDSHEPEDVDYIVNAENQVDMIHMLYGAPADYASKCIRGLIMAEPGKLLLTADWSAIEGRILAWFANEEDILQGYRAGDDMYVRAIAPVLGKSEDSVTKFERQIGKVVELSCGYQGYVGAFAAMAKSYGVTYPKDVEPDLIDKLVSKGKRVTQEALFEAWAGPIIMGWRRARFKTVEFWAGVEQAAISAVKTGKPFAYGRVKFGIRGRFLHCRLPSGRLLSYCDPHIKLTTTKYGKEKEVIGFMGTDSTGRWTRQATYGGKLTENIVQATARDLLAVTLVDLEEEGYNPVMHVHDEAIGELPEDEALARYKDFENVFRRVPSWLAGCPLDAEGWVGKRYRK